MKTELVYKTRPGPRQHSTVIRIYCDCGAVYEHLCPPPNTGCDLPCPQCQPEAFDASNGERLDA